jgi:uncharacterized protein YlxP (DUF503 family)
MQIGVLRVSFVLPGCRSLKEKRQRLGGLRERYGRQVNVAVCESNFQDIHDRSEWTFVAVAQTARLIDQTLVDIEQRIIETVDATISGIARETV